MDVSSVLGRREKHMILIIADNKDEKFGRDLYKYYTKINEDVEFVSASGMNIKPCYGCGGCTQKTFGKCLVRDDMDIIIPLMMKCEKIIYTSPVVWGGFSYTTRKIVDKMSLTGNVFYKVKKKELIKTSKSKMKKIIGIGISDNISDKERISYENQVKSIAKVTGIKYLGKVFGNTFTDQDIEKLALEVNKI